MMEKKNRNPLVAIFGAAVLFVCVALATYFSIEVQGRIPEMPRVPFSDDRSRESLEALEKRTTGFAPTTEETSLLEQLQDVHVVEADRSQGTPPNLRHLLDGVQQRFSAYAARARDRYLTLGDTAALSFHRVLMDTLQSATPHSVPDGRVYLLGGAFYDRALGRGLISADGTPAVPEALFSVLFRYRWRRLGDVDGDADFTDDERRLLYDFQARFLEPEAPERRLAAVEALAALSPAYDVTVAKARILFDAGNKGAARTLLEDAREKGRRDRAVSGFLAALAGE